AATVDHSAATAAGSWPLNYVITRPWVATDGCSNSTAASQTITVQHVSAPLLTTPASTTLDRTATPDPANTGTATATDNCSGATVTHSDATAAGSCAGNYVITRTWVATDG